MKHKHGQVDGTAVQLVTEQQEPIFSVPTILHINGRYHRSLSLNYIAIQAS